MLYLGGATYLLMLYGLICSVKLLGPQEVEAERIKYLAAYLKSFVLTYYLGTLFLDSEVSKESTHNLLRFTRSSYPRENQSSSLVCVKRPFSLQ
jgi:hypothetical protein